MTATCHTDGCMNADIPIDIGDPPPDAETGAPIDVAHWLVVCGPCGQFITDLVP